MEQVTFFLAMIAGFLFGGAIVWLIQRNDLRQAYERARTEFNAEIAGLHERVKSREAQVAELRQSNDDRERRMQELQEQHAAALAHADGGAPVVVPMPEINLDEALRPLHEAVAHLSAQVALLAEARREEPAPAPPAAPSEIEAVRREWSERCERMETHFHEERRDWNSRCEELEDRLRAFGARFAQMGRSLEHALECQAEAAMALESQVLPQVDRLPERRVVAVPPPLPVQDSEPEGMGLANLAEAIGTDTVKPEPVAAEVPEAAEMGR